LLEEIRQSGQLVATEPLADPVQTKTVRPADGPPVVTDGPLAEAKEHFGGYLIVDCDTMSARFAPIEVRLGVPATKCAGDRRARRDERFPQLTTHDLDARFATNPLSAICATRMPGRTAPAVLFAGVSADRAGVVACLGDQLAGLVLARRASCSSSPQSSSD
jgi:YCII-related domain